jgi:hypothetical protein
MRDCEIGRGCDHLSVLDIVSIASQVSHVCLVLPTLDHATALWPVFLGAIRDRHGGKLFMKTSKTSTFMFATQTVLRLWVPYEREPTMWMDWHHERSQFITVSVYSRKDGR